MVHRGMVVDSDVLIRHFRTPPDQKSVSHLTKAFSFAPCHVTTVGIFEICVGASSSEKWRETERILSSLRTLDFDKTSAIRASLIQRELKRNCLGMLEPRDCMIAGICVTNGFPLLTFNISHFDRVKDMAIIYPELLFAASDFESLVNLSSKRRQQANNPSIQNR